MCLTTALLLGIFMSQVGTFPDTETEVAPAAESPVVKHIYARFPSDNYTRFTHMVFDGTDGRVFAGAVNKIFHLDENLRLIEQVSTGPKLDNPSCHARGCDSPDMQRFFTDNVNKILVVDPESRTLIACGSVRQGACEKYNTSDISEIPPQFISLSIAANDESSSTYAFIGPENYNSRDRNNVLYVGTTFTSNGEYRHDVPAISSRKLSDLEFAAFSFSKQSLLRIDVKYRDQFLVKYVYGFNSSDFAYFVIVQKESHLPGQEEKGYVSRLARTCINDENYETYTEVTLECAVRSKETYHLVNYNLIQDAKIVKAGPDLAEHLGIDESENVLVGVFSPGRGITDEPEPMSAVCVYSLQEIEAKFTENIHMCFNGSIKYRNLSYVSGLIMDGKCPSEGSTGNIPYFCDVGLKISGVIPIKAQSFISFENTTLTSVTLGRTETHTVAFLGTIDGYIKKILLTRLAIEYETVAIDPGYSILPDTAVSSSGDFLYVLSTSKISKLKIHHCGSYTNCSACLGARDPYCGWCSLEKRCTVRSACQKASPSSPRWLSVVMGQRCIDFIDVLPEKIPITEMTTVYLRIRTLPELPYGAKYRCVFGTAVPIDAIVRSSGLLCSTPSVSVRPIIPENADHVLVPLSVRSSETNKDFMSTNFVYFDCERHSTCRSCATSQWGCNWCLHDNKCTYNITSCRRADSVISGQNSKVHSVTPGVSHCPRFRKTVKDILLPNNEMKDIFLEVENLPEPETMQLGFLCIVDIEGAKMVTPARASENRFVICSKTSYTYEANVEEYKANLTVVWNRKHYIDTITVTLYKCEFMGSHKYRPDCSLCLALPSKYNCTWCKNRCAFRQSCYYSPSAECPKPRIEMVRPLVGPVEGGTLVTIEGSNLGVKEEDFRGNISIGKSCELIDYEISFRIVCRTAASPSGGESMVPIRVGSAVSPVHYSYKDYKLEGVFPFVGPQSGGTLVTITGDYLNIGSSASATLDGLPCYVNSTEASRSALACITSRSATPRTIRKLVLSIDGANRTLEGNLFNYTQDPTIMEIKPLKSFASGGRMITVHGTNLDTIQRPEMIVYMFEEPDPANKSSCFVISSVRMECPSPVVDLKSLIAFRDAIEQRKKEYLQRYRRPRSASKFQEIQLTMQIGFIMDNVETVRNLKKHFRNLRSQLLYVDDPKFFQFPNMMKSYKGDTLVIEGENLNLASDETDVNVTIGTVPCNVTSLALTQLVCSPPDTQPRATDELGNQTDTGLPLVVVRVGTNLRFPIGYLKYEVLKPYVFLPEAMVGITVGTCCLVFLFLIVLVIYRRKSTQAEREYKRIQIQMDTLESNVRSECKLAFAELQTDMTDLTADLESTGIPMLDHKSYVMKVFFPGVGGHPILNEPKPRSNSLRNNYDAAMFQFEQLVNNKNFILTFIETLEAQKSFNMRDKVSVASLVMVALMEKMEYATDVMTSLLLRLIEKSVDTKYPQLMLRRTESVVEKMLTNWMALCMYDYLKDYAGSSLFLLYKAIKHQVEKGPVDAVTHDARYSLSEERLLREQIDHFVVTIHLVQEDLHFEKISYQTLQVVQDELNEKIQCKVLDCDTIGQVKSKILDALYKNTHFSLRPSVDHLDLEWRHGRGGHLTLQDEDLTTKMVRGGWKRLNTLAHYGVKDSAVMSLVPRQHESYCKKPCRNCSCTRFDNALSPVGMTNGDVEGDSDPKFFHLVKPVDEHQFSNKTGSNERTHKAIPEIFLTRLLSTKGTIQKFVDDFFGTILTADDALPPAVKWLFDFLDEAGKRHSILDPEVVHAWKSNSLPLRFWVNFIKNPDFIFDVNKTPTVDSCLSVIAQTLMDSCSTTEHRLGKDSPSNKLLFAKDILQYRDMVTRFYRDVRTLPQITDQEMSTAMQQLSVSQAGEFDVVAALKELYIYVTRYASQILEALETDPVCKKMHLAQKLENVAFTLKGEETLTC